MHLNWLILGSMEQGIMPVMLFPVKLGPIHWLWCISPSGPIIGSVRFSAPSLLVRTWGLFIVLFVLFLAMHVRRSYDKAAIKIREKQENMQ